MSDDRPDDGGPAFPLPPPGPTPHGGSVHMMMHQATEIPMHDCGLTINCGEDGVWLHFAASNGKHALINVAFMAEGGITGAALQAWTEDRRKQAENIKRQPCKPI